MKEICASYGSDITCIPGELFIAVAIFDCFLGICMILFGWSIFDWFKKRYKSIRRK